MRDSNSYSANIQDFIDNSAFEVIMALDETFDR